MFLRMILPLGNGVAPPSPRFAITTTAGPCPKQCRAQLVRAVLVFSIGPRDLQVHFDDGSSGRALLGPASISGGHAPGPPRGGRFAGGSSRTTRRQSKLIFPNKAWRAGEAGFSLDGERRGA